MCLYSKEVFCLNANKNKLIFPTYKDAELYKRQYNHKLQVYHCPICNGFHLTHKLNRKKRKYKKYSIIREPDIVKEYIKSHPIKKLTIKDLLYEKSRKMS